MKIYRMLPAVLLLLLSAAFSCGAERQYYAIFIDGQKCGYAVHSRVVSTPTVKSTEKIALKIDRFLVPVEVTMSETCIETQKGEPLGFEVVQDLSAWRTTISGTVSPDGLVKVKSVTGQLKSQKNFDWPEGALMAEGLRLLEEQKGLKEGTQYSAKVFSPSLLKAVDTQITIGGEKEIDLLGRVVSLTEVTTVMNVPLSGKVKSVSYVNDELDMLKALTPMMGMKLEMLACSKEYALSESEPAEFVSKAFVKSPEALNDLNSVDAVCYRLRPTGDTSDLQIPTTDNQKVTRLKDGSYEVTVRPVALPKGEKLPYTGKNEEAVEALKPNRFIQSAHPKIKELAGQAVGDCNDAAEAAKKIEDFVADYIDNRNLSVGYASAVEVAESRTGDCTEFAVLTAALCRAAGIPARVVVGVAYVDEFMNYKSVFGGHAWTEIYIAGKWAGLDAAYKSSGRGGYDAGHITLAAGTGDLEDYFNLVFTLGQFEIEKIKVEK